MNQQERDNLALVIVSTHRYYSAPIDKDVLKMHVDDLSDLDFVDVCSAYQSYRRNPRNIRSPLPAQIRDIITPAENRERDDSDDGRFVAANILRAVSSIGPYRTKDAKEFLGELGWEVVCHLGGWELVCQTTNSDSLPIQQAQWRELAQTLARRSRSGISKTSPRLTNSNQMQSLGDILKLALENKNEI